jgi:hypothetical protein
MDDGRLRNLVPDIGEYRNVNHDAIEAWSINPNEPYKPRDTTNGWTQQSLEQVYAEAFTAVNPNTLFFARKDPYGLQYPTMPTFRAMPPLRYPDLTTIPGLLTGEDTAISNMERDILIDADPDDTHRTEQPVEGGGLVNKHGTREAVDIAVMKDKAQPAEYYS